MSDCNNCGNTTQIIPSKITGNQSPPCKECEGNIFKRKLGKCKLCIAISITGFFIFWFLYFLISVKIYSFIVLIIAACFSVILLAHISAFIYQKKAETLSQKNK